MILLEEILVRIAARLIGSSILEHQDLEILLRGILDRKPGIHGEGKRDEILPREIHQLLQTFEGRIGGYGDDIRGQVDSRNPRIVPHADAWFRILDGYDGPAMS